MSINSSTTPNDNLQNQSYWADGYRRSMNKLSYVFAPFLQFSFSVICQITTEKSNVKFGGIRASAIKTIQVGGF